MEAEGFKEILEGGSRDQLWDVMAAGEPEELFVEEVLEKDTAATVSPSVR